MTPRISDSHVIILKKSMGLKHMAVGSLATSQYNLSICMERLRKATYRTYKFNDTGSAAMLPQKQEI
jgi:hypothetical protein